MGTVQMHECSENQRPTCWLAVGNFGVPSEAWMYRQALGITRLSLRVLCYRNESPQATRKDGLSVEEIRRPTQRNIGRYGQQARLAYWTWKNRHLGGFRGPPVLAQEWNNRLRTESPAVVLCHFGATAIELAPLLLQQKVPVVAHFNGIDLSSSVRRPRYRRELARYAPHFSACVVVADYMAEWLHSHGVPNDQIHKIPYGVPFTDIQPAIDVDEQPCKFLMVGRLTPKKRPDLSIRAFAACVRDAPQSTLTVIGAGPMEEECREIAEDLGVTERVEWLGVQPFDVVKRHLASASAFVQHSVTAESGDKEGWPVAVAEAAGTGLPIVSTRHASIPEQVDHGVTGLLCDEGDWESMAEHMRVLASSPETRVAMGVAGRKKMEAFDTNKQVAELEELLYRAATG